jgi:hypothetical protein
MINRVTRLLWTALDRIDYAAGVARCWVVDLIYGPEPPTLADEKRDADRERLRRAFPNIDIDGSIAVADERQRVQATPTTTVTASDEAPPRSATSVHRPAP